MDASKIARLEMDRRQGDAERLLRQPRPERQRAGHEHGLAGFPPLGDQPVDPPRPFHRPLHHEPEAPRRVPEVGILRDLQEEVVVAQGD